MARLKLYLLGSFRATLDDTPLAGLHSHKGRGLLAYLATQPGDSHQRETLATLLWGEHTEQAARLSLRVELHNLRKALESARPADGGLAYLITSRQQAQLHTSPDMCWVDAREFDALLAACAAHAHHAITRCPACIERLTQAVALYRGDFLADLTLSDSPAFDAWRTVQQEHYHRAVLQALEQIADYHVTQGNYLTAQAAAQRQLELEPWREEAHRQLMRSRALAGERNAALAQYQVAQRIVAAELGATVDAQTYALHAEILSGALMAAGQATAIDHSSITPAPPTTPFVGRTRELRQIGEWLADPTCRLLTLVGPGGVGKTRLAQQAALQYGPLFADGARCLSLHSADTGEGLLLALAEALRMPPAQADAPTFAGLMAYLRHKRLLLVLDDCTPTPALASWIVDLLQSAPDLKVIAIARQRLNVRSEWLMRLEGLACCDICCPICQEGDEPVADLGTDETCDALHLFIACARRAMPHMQLTPVDLSCARHICRLVEGMPLAIELAAAWLSVLTCGEIAAEIENNVDFLATTLSDVPERQRTMRAVFQQAWNSLTPQEQAALARLAVFPTVFDRAAAEAVAGAALPDLAALADRSLLHRIEAVNGRTDPQFSLYSVLKQYVLQELARLSDEPRATRERHAAYYLAFLARQTAALEGEDQQKALNVVAGQIANVRAAWQWAIAHGKSAALAESWYALFTFYDRRSWFREGEAAFGRLAGALSSRPAGLSSVDKTLLAVALASQAWFTYRLDRGRQADQLIRQSLAVVEDEDAPEALAFVVSRREAILLEKSVHGAAL